MKIGDWSIPDIHPDDLTATAMVVEEKGFPRVAEALLKIRDLRLGELKRQEALKGLAEISPGARDVVLVLVRLRVESVRYARLFPDLDPETAPIKVPSPVLIKRLGKDQEREALDELVRANLISFSTNGEVVVPPATEKIVREAYPDHGMFDIRQP